MRFGNNIGFLLLAIYLILIGISALAGLALHPLILPILALIAGIFILIGR
jgi:hypothetical protein